MTNLLPRCTELSSIRSKNLVLYGILFVIVISRMTNEILNTSTQDPSSSSSISLIKFSKNRRYFYNTTIVPPTLIQTPQEGNGYRSFQEQCLQYCISAYEASPAIYATSSSRGSSTKTKAILQLPTTTTTTTTTNESSLPPPRILHVIHLADTDPDITFTLADVLMFRAAYFRIQPDQIHFHTDKEPRNSPYWDMIKPMIYKHHKRKIVSQIFGNPISGKSHKSDVARMQVLQKYGGLYMDIDVIALRPFTDKLWDVPKGITMGLESIEMKLLGCAVIIARRDSKFLKRWYESYVTFNDSEWAEHAVMKPMELSNIYPDEIQLLPESYFYRPLWDDTGFARMWDEQPMNSTDVENYNLTYASHYWGKFARDRGHIAHMTPATILNENRAIYQLFRPLLPYPFFTFVIRCTSDLVIFNSTIESIIGQTFPLWEIVVIDDTNKQQCQQYLTKEVIPNVPRLRDELPISIRFVTDKTNYPVAIHTKGIWMTQIDPGDEISSDKLLDDMLEQFKSDPYAKEFKSTIDGRLFEFVYNPNIGITRLPQDVIVQNRK